MQGSNKQILEKYEEFWISSMMRGEYSELAQIIRGILHFFGDDPACCDQIEQKVIFLESCYDEMSLEEFSRCSKAVTYARRRIGHTRGTNFASGLSRALTDTERAILRGAGPESDRSGHESNGAGGEGIGEFARDLLADDSDDS